MDSREVMMNKPNYLGPFITMVILMALVGLITTINMQFQGPMQAAYLKEAGDLKNTLATLINFAFFLAYLLMGNSSAKSLEKNGYRGTLIRGLLILLAAFALFGFSAWQFNMSPDHTMLSLGKVTVPFAFFIFLIGSFTAGTALTFLQSATNPYVIACDVKGTSGVQRQTIAGAANSTMTTIGPILVASVIFGGRAADQIQVSSLYIPLVVLIIVVAILTFILTRLSLPDIPAISTNKDEKLPQSVWKFSHLSLGALALFCYVGVEVSVGANINLHAISLKGQDGSPLYTIASAAKLASMYWGGMLIGRLLGSFISKIPANTQLLFTSLAAGILVILAMVTRNPWFLVGMGLFHSIMWPAIFSLALEGLGRYTSKGSGALMMGVVGGAVLPLIQGILADALGNWNITWTIVVLGELVLFYYALIGHKVKMKDESVIVS